MNVYTRSKIKVIEVFLPLRVVLMYIKVIYIEQ